MRRQVGEKSAPRHRPQVFASRTNRLRRQPALVGTRWRSRLATRDAAAQHALVIPAIAALLDDSAAHLQEREVGRIQGYPVIVGGGPTRIVDLVATRKDVGHGDEKRMPVVHRDHPRDGCIAADNHWRISTIRGGVRGRDIDWPRFGIRGRIARGIGVQRRIRTAVRRAICSQAKIWEIGGGVLRINLRVDRYVGVSWGSGSAASPSGSGGTTPPSGTGGAARTARRRIGAATGSSSSSATGSGALADPVAAPVFAARLSAFDDTGTRAFDLLTGHADVRRSGGINAAAAGPPHKDHRKRLPPATHSTSVGTPWPHHNPWRRSAWEKRSLPTP